MSLLLACFISAVSFKKSLETSLAFELAGLEI